MENLEEIAKELKEFIGEKVILLEGVEGKTRFGPVFAATLYEIKKDKDNNIIIEFNEYFKEFLPNTVETEEYKKVKEFSEKNNYKLQLRKYDMTPPEPKFGVLF